MRKLAALLLSLATCAQAADAITFPVHVMYRAHRLQMPTQATRLKVCPLPTPVADCAAGAGWFDPTNTSSVPGYLMRYVV